LKNGHLVPVRLGACSPPPTAWPQKPPATNRQALPNLGAIVHQGAGYDTIDVDAARRLGIGVSNTPTVLNDAVADTAVGLMLATMRGLCVADR
jgi:lactate dehydrogenase-like 2-hydroxyacid dehydrogenase